MPIPSDLLPPNRLARAAIRWGTVFVVGLLLACFWSLIVWLADLQRERTVAENSRDLSARAAALSQQAAGLFVEIETDLRIMELWLQSNSGTDPLRDPMFRSIVEEMRQAAGGLFDLRMASSDGQVFSIAAPGAEAALAADQDMTFVETPLVRGNHPRALHVGTPVRARDGTGWRLPVSLHMPAPARRVLVPFVQIDVKVWSRAFDRTRAGSGDSIVLMRGDGIVISRAPLDAAPIGVDLSATSLFTAEFGIKDKGGFLTDANGSLGGDRQLVSYQRLDGYPVTVMATRDLSDALRDFKARRRLVFGLCFGLTLLAFAFAVWLQRLRHELDHAQQELERLANLDPLTDIMNRRALTESATREFSRAQRSKSPAAVLALDIDHFKQINDTHGHAAGDHVLKECARRWKTSLRAHDVLGRMGGEEFCVLLPDTPADGALMVAERLRTTIMTPPLSGVAQVTVSIGVSHWQADDLEWSAALARADKALYEAKSGGRNRVCEAGDTARVALSR